MKHLGQKATIAIDRCVAMILAATEQIEVIGQDDSGVIHMLVEAKIARDYFGEPIGSELDRVVQKIVRAGRMRWREDVEDIGTRRFRLQDVPTGVPIDVHVSDVAGDFEQQKAELQASLA